MRINIQHKTTYRYDTSVVSALQQLRLAPKSSAGQAVISWDMHYEGGKREVEFEDHNNNHVTLISFETGRDEITVTCVGAVETTDQAGVIGRHGDFAPLWYFRRQTALTQAGPRIKALAKSLPDNYENDVTRLHDLSRLIAGAVNYQTGETGSETKAESALEAGQGVCQDHAHIFVSVARELGFPARYVSGYLLMHDRIDQTATHAWAEAFISDIGWVGFDVSNGISPDEHYVRVATGLDYSEAAPISGMRFGHGGETLVVDIQVQQ